MFLRTTTNQQGRCSYCEKLKGARLNCSWIGAGAESANLTLLVDGEEQNGETVIDNHGSLTLTLDWSTKNMTVGQGVVVSCNGRTGCVFSKISFEF